MTDTGRRRATSLIPEARVTLAPFDFKPAVDRFLAALGPGLVIIAETELWPNLIMETARRSASLVLVNGRISERSIGRYRLIPGPMRLMLSRFDLMAMRSRKDAERAISLGAPPDRVVIAGNTKYDALPGPAPGEIKSNLRVSMGIPPGKPVITLGSARPGETEVLLEALAHVEAAPVVVIAPRHLDQVARVERVCREWGYDLGRSKSPEAIGGAGGKAPGKRVALIVNEMGKLLEFYSISDIAVLGGSFAPFGGHNPLEPASQGVPLIVGPHHENIADDMAHLVSAGAAFIVDAGELGPRIAGWLEKPDMRASAGRKAMEVVDSNRGAAARCLEEIVKRGLLP
jgi:3-deoxy-D-manno-octulosonic-acid transferase